MSEQNNTDFDYSQTLYLPKTEFPMRASLPVREPEILARWDDIDLYKRQREVAKVRETFLLHDGPPYANGNIHIGTALNKILKDIVNRSMQSLGYDANYVPGWDCHGLPIEWKVEEQYRAKGKDKGDIAINDFRAECRAFARHWIDEQRREFKRLGVIGDWQAPYLTMTYKAEATICAELFKIKRLGALYQGSKPVMWSVVEQTVLAEAEVEYHKHKSKMIWVGFPIVAQHGRVLANDHPLYGAKAVIWTTTPWTIPANRAICYSPDIEYGLYEVTESHDDNWVKVGQRYVMADDLAESVFKASRVESFKRIDDANLEGLVAQHPLAGQGYDFDVVFLSGDHVTAEAGTGLVHTAPGHGADDYRVWVQNGLGEVPHIVEADGTYAPSVPLFAGKAVLTSSGKEGGANEAVIAALLASGHLLSRGVLEHDYPHSWRSRAPIIFRNTPQWFISMSEGVDLRNKALKALESVRFVPETGRTRLTSMIETRPDWVISRQRAWGVPIAVFVNKLTRQVLDDAAVDKRIVSAFEEEGADAWFAEGAAERFLGADYKVEDWLPVYDILDVWFDSGSTHSFVLEERDDVSWPASLYLEGSDQHRGWFQSSLLESCATRGRAPFDAILTHGFVVDDKGRKMSKSLGNFIAPDTVIKQYGAEILRLWVASVDYAEDLRIGNEVLKATTDTYRKIRNSLRWMLGNLAHAGEHKPIVVDELPALERWLLHQVFELDALVCDRYKAFDYKRVMSALVNFINVDLSAFYFDVRKDVLYCDGPSSLRRQASLAVLEQVFRRLVHWLAPVLCFTAEEAWKERYGDQDISVHLVLMDRPPASWRHDDTVDLWRKVRLVRRVVTGAIEIERREKRIGSSLEAAPAVYIEDADLFNAVRPFLTAELCITSGIDLHCAQAPEGAFKLDDVDGIGVVPKPAQGKRCARSWVVSPDIGSDPDWPDISPRCAGAMRDKGYKPQVG